MWKFAPAHAANGRRLTRSVCGSLHSAHKTRCSDGVCVKFDISLLSLWLSPSKKLSNTG